MLHRTNPEAKNPGKVPVLCRWFITLAVILFVIIYQLGVKSSPAVVSVKEESSSRLRRQEIKTAQPVEEKSETEVIVATEITTDPEPELVVEVEPELAVITVTESESKAEPVAEMVVEAIVEPKPEVILEPEPVAEPVVETVVEEVKAPEPEVVETALVEEAIDLGPWKDGEYEGEGEGYGGVVRIKLKVTEGWISSIEVTEARGEDKPYLRDAKQIIPMVIECQSTDLDGISGATSTSWAILDAIDMALEEEGR